MVFEWWKRRRRRQARSRPFPETWSRILDRNVLLFARLSATDQEQVRQYLQVFVPEKNWEGCGGLEMTDEVRVTIGAHVAILALGFGEEYFERVVSILVYPDAYEAPEETVTPAGVVLEGHSEREGEAWYRGPVILSWTDTLLDAQDPDEGRNVVLHEFAHQLDMLNGQDADGMPPLESSGQQQQWLAVMRQEMERLARDCERGRPTILDCYGTSDESEFFAVATEAFFLLPREMNEKHPALYGVLRDFFRQDPAQW